MICGHIRIRIIVSLGYLDCRRPGLLLRRRGHGFTLRPSRYGRRVQSQCEWIIKNESNARFDRCIDWNDLGILSVLTTGLCLELISLRRASINFTSEHVPVKFDDDLAAAEASSGVQYPVAREILSRGRVRFLVIQMNNARNQGIFLLLRHVWTQDPNRL